jgi:hypothetical protein
LAIFSIEVTTELTSDFLKATIESLGNGDFLVVVTGVLARRAASVCDFVSPLSTPIAFIREG